MTLQVERPDQASSPAPPLPPRHRRGSTIALVAGLAVAVAAVSFAAMTSSGHEPRSPHPAVVLGTSRAPLPVHRVISRGTVHAVTPGQRLVPVLGQPGRQVLVRARPAVDLHVRYVHVRPVAGNWQLEMVATEGSEFTMAATRGRSYEALVDGRGLPLFFVSGNADGANFGIGGGVSLTESQAVAIASSLTTRVTVAHCTPAAIADNMCA